MESTGEHTPIIRTSSDPAPIPGGIPEEEGEGQAGGVVANGVGGVAMEGRASPVKSLTLTHTDSVKSMAEKEKILNECMNQIKVSPTCHIHTLDMYIMYYICLFTC